MAFRRWGRQTRQGWVKISSFLSLTVNISKTVADTAKVTINMESHMGIPLKPKSMTLDDFELLLSQILLEFRAISYIWKQ